MSLTSGKFLEAAVQHGITVDYTVRVELKWYENTYLVFTPKKTKTHYTEETFTYKISSKTFKSHKIKRTRTNKTYRHPIIINNG